MADGALLRVLAFEDSYDMKEILAAGAGSLELAGIELGRISLSQRWSSHAYLDEIREVQPDVLLLDFYMPPHTGLEVLRGVNAAVLSGELVRPSAVLGMSSEPRCNQQILAAGADAAFVKWDVWRWEGFDGVRAD